MSHPCSNALCSHGDEYEDDEGTTHQKPAPAYSQDEKSWSEGRPRYLGLCLNCWYEYESLEESL